MARKKKLLLKQRVNSKSLIGYLDEVIKPLVLLPLCIKDDKLLEKCGTLGLRLKIKKYWIKWFTSSWW